MPDQEVRFQAYNYGIDVNDFMCIGTKKTTDPWVSRINSYHKVIDPDSEQILVNAEKITGRLLHDTSKHFLNNFRLQRVRANGKRIREGYTF